MAHSPAAEIQCQAVKAAKRAYIVEMTEKAMPSVVLKNLPATEAAAAIKRSEAAEPGRQRYTVIVQRLRTRDEIAAGMDEVFAEQVCDPSIAGLSDDEVMDIVNTEIAAYRAEKRGKNT